MENLSKQKCDFVINWPVLTIARCIIVIFLDISYDFMSLLINYILRIMLLWIIASKYW